MRALLAPLILVITAGGCAHSTRSFEEREDGKRAIVFGYIDMSDAPTKMEYVYLKQVKPRVEKPYWKMAVLDGIFFIENLPMGSFQVSDFGGSSGISLGGGWKLGGTNYRFEMPVQMAGIRIRRPGLYFLGALKYEETGNFFNRGFTLTPLTEPSEAEVIRKLLPKAQGTRWENILNKRLRYLEK